MTTPLIKICGLSTPETLDGAIRAGADWIGLVHFEKSPRHLTAVEAGALAEKARGRAAIVLLTVNADDQTLDTLITQVKPDLLQLHGDETAERLAAIKARYGLPLIKAIGVAAPSDLASLQSYTGLADHFLLDAKPPRNAALPGGNGQTFNWDILRALPTGMPFILSGGLTGDNVAEAIIQTAPAGIDVSSGVERAAGVKDNEMIDRFIKAARSVGLKKTLKQT